VTTIIDETLQLVAREGFEQSRVDAIIHQIELSLKHVRSTFGISLITAMIPYWQHRVNPLTPLNINDRIASFRQRLSSEPYFQQLIQKHFLNNPHRVTLVMNPDPQFAVKEAAIEKKRLAAIEAKLNDDDRKRIVTEAAELKYAFLVVA
jgi:Zn-dependent M16 (insulinase) family peptidase